MGNNSSSELSADEVATQVRHHYYYGAGAPNTFIRKVKTGHDHEAGAEEEVAGDATTPADSPQQCNPHQLRHHPLLKETSNPVKIATSLKKMSKPLAAMMNHPHHTPIQIPSLKTSH
ncbi:uncharacterized protein [Macrobrachium rosenbergii]|uniref:uncharacterized protein n=1 Tax=Macrobrachium rosenbergii TaxID=79674 RepID=UPI0034D4DD11